MIFEKAPLGLTKLLNMSFNFFLISLLFCVSTIFGQTQWTKYANNPVLTKGPSNWDNIAIGQPTCLIENDTIKMWYVGVGIDMKARICHATSMDGINWTKYNNGNPVLNVGNPGEWDSGWLDAPEIVKSPTGYFLYYYGDTIQQSAEINSSYGVATSPDGINWTKYSGNPVLIKGNLPDWDGKWIESPAVIYDNVSSTFKMWYNGVATNWLIKIGYATSPDGFIWTKYNGNPVMDVGTGGSFDDMWLGTPAVILRNNTYEMWYSGFSSISGFDTLRIGFATSSDGITWSKYSGNPLLNTFTSPYDSLIDDGGPWAPDVIFDSNSSTFKMWTESNGGFSLATSPVNLSTAIKSNTSLFDNVLTIFPNPFSQTTLIKSTINLHNATLVVFNVYGQVVEQKSNLNGTIFRMEKNNLTSGIYFLKIIENGEVLNGKLIVE